MIAHGTLPKQHKTNQNQQILLDTLQINSISTLYILEILAEKMSEKKQGTIAVITSLTVENNNHHNYIYACSKAVVANYLKGFSYNLRKKNIKVLDIRPALIKTPMTEHLQKKIVVTPEHIAKDIFTAIVKGNKRIIYTPFYWRFIMLIIRNIPETFFSFLYELYCIWNKKK